MAQRGRVVIDLSEDSPPPEPRRSQLRIPDSRFITPSDEDDDNDDSDDSVEIRWTVHQQRHDVGGPKSLSAGQPTKLQNPQPVGQSIKKNATVPFPVKHRPTQLYQPLLPQPSTTRPPVSSSEQIGTTRPSAPPATQPVRSRVPSSTQSVQSHRPPPNTQRPGPPPDQPRPTRDGPVSITNPLTRQWFATLSKSRTGTPLNSGLSRPILRPGASSLSPRPPVSSAQHQQLDPLALPRASQAQTPHTHAETLLVPKRSMKLSHVLPTNLSHTSPAPSTSLPSRELSRDVSRASPKTDDIGHGHVRNVLPSSSARDSGAIAPSRPRLPSEMVPMSPRPPSPGNAMKAPEPSPGTLPNTTLTANQQNLSVQPNTQTIEVIELDMFATAVDNSSSSASPPLNYISQRTSKRRLGVVESDSEVSVPVKRARRNRPSENQSEILDSSVEPQVAQGADIIASVETGHSFTFPDDISQIPPFQNRFGQPFTAEEDALVRYLKEIKALPWREFERFFPGRKWTSMQSRYSKVLRPRAAYPDATTSLSRPITQKPARVLRRMAHAYTDSENPSVSSPEEMSDATDDAHRCRRSVRPLNYLVRHRELGWTSGRDWPRRLQTGMRDLVYSSMGAQAYMDDASGDVSTIAWSPNGKSFAAGAVAVTDLQSVDYNKPRNLVIGRAESQKIKELPNHTIKRLLPDGRQKELFSTVQMVAFSPDSNYMYSAGIDQNLHRYRINSCLDDTALVHMLQHPASVDFLAVSNNGLVATGCASSDAGAVRVLSYDDDDSADIIKFSGMIQSKKYPSALRWGLAHDHQNYLLAGFSREAEAVYAEDDNRDKEGEVALWDVNTQQRIDVDAPNRNVFDLAWNPNPSGNSSIFAVASRPFGHVSQGIHSVVRLYSPRQNHAQHTMELDCPAWDVNDVVYSPHDSNIIAVGSTEGRVYIWDIRMTKQGQSPLSTLRHGDSLAIMPHEKRRWEADTGIRFLSWGSERNRLYSGSSDGVVACWDPYRSDADKHVRDVVQLNSAVMSGAFSPDFCHLLVGEDAARLNMLTVGNEGATFNRTTTARFAVEKAPLQEEAARTLWDCEQMHESGALEIQPAGTMPFRQVVQGPNYSGPYRPESEDEGEGEASKARENAQKFQDKVLRSLRRRNKQVRKSGVGQAQPCQLDCGFIPLPDDYDFPKRWLSDRIPDKMRTWMKTTEAGGRGGKLSCSRCGQAVTMTARGHAIECENCGAAWSVGALGYDLIEQVKVSHAKKAEDGSTGNAVDLCDSEDERERFVREVTDGLSDDEL
ncbi:WD40 repeat-like protein [Aureobasidium subglaciale]|nr:WD40 repeat-like protein [Aureobasidium subglaciale]